MKSKYNIVFYPTSKQSEFTRIAQQFAEYSDEYLLGKNSLPHVTLYQFEAEDKDLDNVWQQARETFTQKTIHLRFDKIKSVAVKNFYGISLIPDNIDTLQVIHTDVAKLLQLPIRPEYDPHLTLFNSLNQDFLPAMNKFAETFAGIEDEFTLALGTSDFIGQFKQVIFNSALAPLIYK
jgi:2'-5' RNA ligase